jgi:hypothetical protein
MERIILVKAIRITSSTCSSMVMCVVSIPTASAAFRKRTFCPVTVYFVALLKVFYNGIYIDQIFAF